MSLSVLAFTNASTDADAYAWDFGDGQGSDELTPSHQYAQPGFYTVSLTVNTGSGSYTKVSPGLVSAHADTLEIGVMEAPPAGNVVAVGVTARNHLPLGRLVIPFSWDGPFNLSFDSFTVVNTRTAHFDFPTLASSSRTSKRATLDLVAGTAIPIEPGSGIVATLFFTVPPGVTGFNPISLIEYGTRISTFEATAGAYQPATIDGGVLNGVVTSDCCSGQVGDVNVSGADIPTIGDISSLVDHLFLDPRAFDCTAEADINQSGGSYPTFYDITIGDISELVDHLFITKAPLPSCQ